MRPGLSTSSLRLLAAALSCVALGAGVTACTTVTTPKAEAPSAAAQPTLAAAEDLARQDAQLTGAARAENAARIAHLLAGLDDATLAREAAALPAGDPLYTFAGQALLNRGLPLPRPFEWRFDAGNRPPAESDGYRPPVRLGVLLPLSGELSRAAAPVRDGLLAGYYGEQRRRPEIAFYDTAGTAGGAIAAYQHAVADGADYVVGPLGRDEVGALFHERLDVPVLALNRGTVAPPASSASFSLAPEDDGIAAAEFLLARKTQRVLVLGAEEESMRRAVAAFRAQLQERGGTVTDVVMVADKPVDMTATLQAAAQKAGGVDAVFLALKAAQARALAPQLAAAGLGSKPRVATSQFAGSEGDAGHALDGIAFPSEAWAVRSVGGLPSLATAARTLPSARGAAAKLFAFGYDAWLLTAYLERLATQAGASLPGATGTLRLDGFGNVVRTPAWSTFSGTSVLPLGQ